MAGQQRLPLAVSMGEPAGIGGEIALQAWMRRDQDVPPFVLLDDADRVRALSARLGWDVPVQTVEQPEQAVACFDRALPVVHHPLPVLVCPGQPDPANAAQVAAAIRHGVEWSLAGRVAGLVTNPIHKGVMYQGGFAFPGHTEYLAHLLGMDGQEVMLLACSRLRVVPVTIHLSLKQAIVSLTRQRIVEVATITHRAMQQDFGLDRPRLALSGLNPHAGEDGAMGDEEQTIIQPAIDDLRRQGMDVLGPLPADTMFHDAARRAYDVALCMYHDQALIPVKTLGFDEGVNATLGLPIVRTSPDHGTAFGVAGQGVADPGSLMAALRMADGMAKQRLRHKGQSE